MSQPTSLEMASSGIAFVIALAWASLARAGWWRVRAHRGPAAFAWLGALLTSALAVIYLCLAIFPVVPESIDKRPHPVMIVLYFASDAVPFFAVAVFRQWTRLFALRAEPVTPRWRALNYGSAAVMILVALYVHVIGCGGGAFRAYQMTAWTYMLFMLGSSVREISPLARGGSWRPGSTSVARRPDIVVLTLAVACMLAILALHATGSWNVHREMLDVLQVLLGATLLLPFAVRNLGGLLVGMGTNLGTLAGVGAVLVGARELDAWLADPALRPVTLVFVAASLIAVLGPWQRLLVHGLDRLVLRRRRDRWSRLQEFLRALSPELGSAECARRATARLHEGMHLRGAALLLRDGGDIAVGELTLAGIAELWPRGDAADAFLPAIAITDDLMALPPALRAALVDADVVGVVPVRGAHRLWGHLLLSTDLVGTSFFEDELDSIEAFADQLARILDGADMLARVVSVERSLAHAEKLAAIGELAARVAHEIRNPVTAARSLAQTLSRDPTSPLNAEHAEIILTELTRVERQIAALLRFARREELHLEPADLGLLLRETAERFATRLADDAICCAVDAPDGVVVRVDRDKMRQVLINLIENSIDALAERTDGGRRLTLSLEACSDASAVVVSDNGPGQPEAALPRLFEPFFSLKAQGTGLGLAIVKRTVEAHGGTVSVARLAPDGGLAFRVELPRAHETSRAHPAVPIDPMLRYDA
jgi:signal transduction histidine kinase